MWSYAFWLFLVLWEIGSPITLNDCPETLERDKYLAVFENRCYYFYVNIAKEFDDAQEECQKDGGNLASVKTSEVNDFIWKRLDNEYDVHDKVWIGLSDQDEEGEYEWRDGSKMDYNNFDYGQGTNTHVWEISEQYEDCVAMRYTGKWVDISCSQSPLFASLRERFVCEYAPMQSPCPSTLPRDEYLQVLDSSCYYFHLNSRLDFPTAQTTCQDHGGNLVSIKSQRVQDFIWNTLRYTYELGTEPWIGLRDDKDDGVFVWRDGSVAEYKNFDSREESHFSADCVAMQSYSGKWYGHGCADQSFYHSDRNFICEFSAESKTRSTTTTSTQAYSSTISTTTLTNKNTPITTTNSPSITISTPPTTRTTPIATTTTLATTTPTINTPAIATTTEYTDTATPDTTTSSITTGRPTTTTNIPTTVKPTTTTDRPTTTTNIPTTVKPTTTTDRPTTIKSTTTTNTPTTRATTPSTTTITPTTTPTNPTTTAATTTPTNQTTLHTTTIATVFPTSTTATTVTTTITPTTTITSSTTPTPTITTTRTTTKPVILTTTTTPSTSTTVTATTTNIPEITFPKDTTPAVTCPPIVCELDCGMLGYDTDPISGCLVCQCQG